MCQGNLRTKFLCFLGAFQGGSREFRGRGGGDPVGFLEAHRGTPVPKPGGESAGYVVRNRKTISEGRHESDSCHARGEGYYRGLCEYKERGESPYCHGFRNNKGIEEACDRRIRGGH